MRKNKKKIILSISLLLGFITLVTSAFADVKIETGYDKFKDAIKYSASIITEKSDSYTLEISYQFKESNEFLFSADSIIKIDRINSLKEYDTLIKFCNGDFEHRYWYCNGCKHNNIYDNKASQISYIDRYERHLNDLFYDIESNHFVLSEDYEKIIDALVGELKEYVFFDKKKNGKVMFSGRLNENQIPILANYILSLIFKGRLVYQEIGDIGLPKLEEDVCVRKITGRANTTEDGLIENISAEISVIGKDIEGKSHELTFEVFVKLSDINSKASMKNC